MLTPSIRREPVGGDSGFDRVRQDEGRHGDLTLPTPRSIEHLHRPRRPQTGAPASASSCHRQSAARRIGPSQDAWRSATSRCRPTPFHHACRGRGKRAPGQRHGRRAGRREFPSDSRHLLGLGQALLRRGKQMSGRTHGEPRATRLLMGSPPAQTPALLWCRCSGHGGLRSSATSANDRLFVLLRLQKRPLIEWGRQDAGSRWLDEFARGGGNHRSVRRSRSPSPPAAANQCVLDFAGKRLATADMAGCG